MFTIIESFDCSCVGIMCRYSVWGFFWEFCMGIPWGNLIMFLYSFFWALKKLHSFVNQNKSATFTIFCIIWMILCWNSVWLLCMGIMLVYSVWVLCVGTLYGYSVWVLCVGTLCGYSLWVLYVGTLFGNSVWNFPWGYPVWDSVWCFSKHLVRH